MWNCCASLTWCYPSKFPSPKMSDDDNDDDDDDRGAAATSRPIAIALIDLPSELISEILGREEIACGDLRAIGNACRRLRKLVSADSHMWMNKMCKEWPDLMSLKNTDLNWFNEYKNMMSTFSQCRKKIIKMSSTYYWAPISLSDCHICKDFMPICDMYGGRGLLYSLIFLRDLCSHEVPEDYRTPQSCFYNLTNQHYAMIVLDFLCQYSLKRNWSNMFKIKNNPYLTPEKVMLFFNQWMEPKYGDYSNEFDATMSSIAKTIISFLPNKHPLRDVNDVERKTWSTLLISNNKYDGENCRVVIKLACDVIKNQEKLSSDAYPTYTLLFIRNIIRRKQSNKYYSPLILEAVLRRCGIRCDLSFYYEHHFLVWRENWEENSLPYFINPYTGEIEPATSRCPFAPIQSIDLDCYDYLPLNLLINIAYRMANSCVENRKTRRVIKRPVELLSFLSPNDIEHCNTLGKLYLELKNDTQSIEKKMRSILNSQRSGMLHLLREEAEHILHELSKNNKNQNIKKLKCKKAVKLRNQSIQFAVGLVCRHKGEGYLCVIKGWDTVCKATEEWKLNAGVEKLTYGEEQPFYYVTANDSTDRYAAQESLMCMKPSYRLYHLEDELGAYFTHYNGNFYVPNAEKNQEYPEDDAVRLGFYESCLEYNQ